MSAVKTVNIYRPELKQYSDQEHVDYEHLETWNKITVSKNVNYEHLATRNKITVIKNMVAMNV